MRIWDWIKAWFSKPVEVVEDKFDAAKLAEYNEKPKEAQIKYQYVGVTKSLVTDNQYFFYAPASLTKMNLYCNYISSRSDRAKESMKNCDQNNALSVTPMYLHLKRDINVNPTSNS
jgi:hypothetical protein